MLIKTNPVFKNIVFKCWEDATGNGGQGIDKIEAKCSYQIFIPEAVEALYPEASIGSGNITDLWRQMKNLNLASSERKKPGKGWRFFLFNPNEFDWDCSEKALYRWLSAKAEVSQALEPSAEESAMSPELDAGAIIEHELRGAQGRLQELEEKQQAIEQKKIRLQGLLKDLQEVINTYDALQKLEQEKIALLKGEEATEEEGQIIEIEFIEEEEE